LIKTFQECESQYLKGELSLTDIKQNSYGFQTFKKFLQARVENFDTLLKAGEQSFKVDVKLIDAFGRSRGDGEKCNPNRMIMIRM
jgi:hypothetical protein